MRSSPARSSGTELHSAQPFAPSLIPPPPDAEFVRKMLGEAGRFLAEHPHIASPRSYVDLWNLFRHRARSLEIDDFGWDEVAARSSQPLFEFLYRVWWRITMKGAQNIPNDGRALLVSNHAGIFPWDATMIGTSILREHPLPRFTRFLVLNWAFELP
ncbi:MAG: hypothetical protein ABIT01_11300, partial [Thermoanaerobaculia bacterium]